MSTNENKTSKPGGSGAFEHIGTQVAAGNLPVGDRLDGAPVLGVEKCRVGQPVGNCLLTDCRPAHCLGEALSECGLGAATNSDGAMKRDNVRFLHVHRYNTNPFVAVNNPVCMTAHKETCTVLQMPASRRKPAPDTSNKNKRVAIPGPDGKTLGQRVREAMAYESGRRGHEYKQTDLVQDVKRVSGMTGPEVDEKLQQSVSAVMLSKVSKSALTPYIARACHVDPIWMASGLGSMFDKS